MIHKRPFLFASARRLASPVEISVHYDEDRQLNVPYVGGLTQPPLFQMYSNTHSTSSQYQMLRSATPAINRTTAEHMIALPIMTTSSLRMSYYTI